MKLHRPDPALLVRDRRQRIRCDRSPSKPGRQFQRLIAVAHPHLDRRRQPRKERRSRILQGNFRVAILPLRRGPHLAPQVMHDEMKPVADPQHRHTHREQPRIRVRRIRVIHRRRAARKNHSNGLIGLNFSQRRRTGQYDGKDILLANTPRNQLRILRAEIKNDDCLGVHLPVWQGPCRPVKNLATSGTASVQPPDGEASFPLQQRARNASYTLSNPHRDYDSCLFSAPINMLAGTKAILCQFHPTRTVSTSHAVLHHPHAHGPQK